MTDPPGRMIGKPVGAPHPRNRRGVWLFAVTYVIHLLEEYAVGGGFVAWADQVLGVRMTGGTFVAWNALGFGLLCLGAFLVVRDARFGWIEVSIAIAVLGNAALHVAATGITGTYSPGVVTGLLLWSPLAAVRGRAAYRACSRRGRRAGAAVGAAAVLVPIVVMLA